MKTDANALRQKRHDDCKRLAACPKCAASRGMSCGNRVPNESGRVYPRPIWNNHLGALSGGKTVAGAITVTGKIGRTGYKPIGGLHKERWSALTNLDVVVRLSEIGVELDQ